MPLKQYAYVDGDTTIHIRYDTVTEEMHMFGVQNTAPLLLQNAAERKDPSNGFSNDRQGATGRKIASVDPVVYRLWQVEFEKAGGKSQGNWTADWRAFLHKKLSENPQYYTVENLVTKNANDGHIVIK